MTDTLVTQLRDAIRSDRTRIFRELSELVAFNSVHNQPGLEEDCARAAAWVVEALTEAGLKVDTIDTVDGSTAVIGRREVEGAEKTVLLYSHYDIVPVGDSDQWISDALTLTERDGRWYARGAADCKGNLIMHLAALRAAEQAGGPKVNLTVLIEGSEERGGEGLDALIKDRPELFSADAILIADSGNTAVGVPTLTSNLRGGALLSVTVDTLKNPVHSGLFGGGAPDAVAALVRTLDSLRDEHGRTVIDGVTSDLTWTGNAYCNDAFREDAGVLEGVDLLGGGDAMADLVWARPAVTTIGFTSTPVSEAVNAVPATASAKLNLRVPVELDPRETAEALKAHLEAHVPWNARITVSIEDVNPAFATDVTQPATATLRECLAEAYGSDDVALVGSGGSIPLTSVLQDAHPNASIALFGVEEPQCTIHSPNESVDPSEIEHIALAEALFLLRYGQ